MCVITHLDMDPVFTISHDFRKIGIHVRAMFAYLFFPQNSHILTQFNVASTTTHITGPKPQ